MSDLLLVSAVKGDKFNSDPVGNAVLHMAQGQTRPTSPSCRLSGPARCSQSEFCVADIKTRFTVV